MRLLWKRIQTSTRNLSRKTPAFTQNVHSNKLYITLPYVWYKSGRQHNGCARRSNYHLPNSCHLSMVFQGFTKNNDNSKQRTVMLSKTLRDGWSVWNTRLHSNCWPNHILSFTTEHTKFDQVHLCLTIMTKNMSMFVEIVVYIVIFNDHEISSQL